jgi:hypothetical protein
MTQQERAQVAFKGLAVLMVIWAISAMIHALPALVSTFWGLVAHWRGQATGDIAGAAAVALITPVTYAVLGVFVARAAPFLARRLLPPADPPMSLPEETLRAGICLIGFTWLPAVLRAAWLAGQAVADRAWQHDLWRDPMGVVAGTAAAAVLAVVFTFLPGRIARILSRLARGAPRTLVEAGLCLIAGWCGARALRWGAASVSRCFTRGSMLDASEGLPRSWLAARLLSEAATFVLAVLLLALTRRVASRFAARPDEEDADRGCVRIGGMTALSLTVQVGVVYLLCGYLPRLLRPLLLYWRSGRPAGTVLLLLVVPPVSAILVFCLLGWIAGPAARLLSRPAGPEDETGTPAPHLLLEVALAMLAIDYGTLFLQRAVHLSSGLTGVLPQTGPLWLVPDHLAAGLAALAMLLFKGDLARLTAREGPGEEPGRATRAALLQPWLVLLGAWLALRDGPDLVSWVYTSLFVSAEEWPMDIPHWGALVGLLLVFGACRIAGLLSFGPLFRHLGPEPTDT